MDEKTAFYAGICGQPDNLTARLAYADWLDEHGDNARAEFIRAQINGRQAVPGSAEQLQLQQRETELWAENASAWDVRWAQLGVEGCDFYNGFAEDISISWSDYAKHAKTISALSPVRSVRLTNAEQGAPFCALQALTYMPSTIRRLQFQGAPQIYGRYYQPITPQMIFSQLGKCTQLTDLQIVDSGITQFSNCSELLGCVTCMENLCRLAFVNTTTNGGIGQGFFEADARITQIAGMHNLEHLVLQNQGLYGIDQIRALAGMHNLRTLMLPNNRIDQHAVLFATANMPLLEELDLRNNFISMDELKDALECGYRNTIDSGGEAASLISLQMLNMQPLPKDLAVLRDQAAEAYRAAHSEVDVEDIASPAHERQHG